MLPDNRANGGASERRSEFNKTIFTHSVNVEVYI